MSTHRHGHAPPPARANPTRAARVREHERRVPRGGCVRGASRSGGTTPATHAGARARGGAHLNEHV